MQLLKKYLSDHKRVLFGTLLLATINQVFSMLDPQIFRLVIDRFASNPSAHAAHEYALGAGLLLLGTISVAFISRLAKNFQDYYTSVITQKVGTKLYTDALAHAFSLPYLVFEDERSGAILERFQKARDSIQTFITSAINTVFLTLIGIVFVLIYSFFTHWSIGLFYVSIIPILGLVTFTLGKKIKSIQSQIVKERAVLLGSSTETLRNVELVKSLGLEDQEVARLNDTNQKILNLELSKVKVVRRLSFIQGTFINFLRTSLLFLMLWLIFTKAISLGELFAILFYSFYIFGPLYELGTVSANYYEAKASLEAVDVFLKREPEEKPAHPKIFESVDSVSFKNVSFSYQDKDTDAIKNISFNIKKGSTVAFVGPSGSGKSTIIKLLTSLYSPKEGDITINNISMKDIAKDLLRKKIGLVLQETQLFAGTIKENLLFANPDATDASIIGALTEAQAEYLITRNAEGIETKIGEGGIKLSGGERQRLAIARALVRTPELLIFDEATSALDSITEKQITETIKKLNVGKNITQVLVAHRLSTILHADTIYVLEKGALVEEGTHEQLLAKKGLYAALYREQGVSN